MPLSRSNNDESKALPGSDRSSCAGGVPESPSCTARLIADEVGLGKTVVAQHVIYQLSEGLGRPLVVFYMCSNLAIARQNRRKLLEILTPAQRHEADCPIDRLSLLPACEPPTHKKLNLYSLTPDTSIPIRKKHRRDGRQEERALVHALVERIWPGLFDERGKDVFQGSATVNWKHSVRQQRDKASNAALRAAFNSSVRQEFDLARISSSFRSYAHVGNKESYPTVT